MALFRGSPGLSQQSSRAEFPVHPSLTRTSLHHCHLRCWELAWQGEGRAPLCLGYGRAVHGLCQAANNSSVKRHRSSSHMLQAKWEMRREQQHNHCKSPGARVLRCVCAWQEIDLTVSKHFFQHVRKMFSNVTFR